MMNAKELREALKNVPDECPVVIGSGMGVARVEASKARYLDSDSYEGFPDIFAIDNDDNV